MVGSMARIVAQFKQSWQRELEDEAIERACREAGHKWRDRKLNPVTTVRMFLLQILFGNAACDFVPHLAGKRVTGASYCEARGRLPLAALQALLTSCTTRMAECVRDTGRWLGHRLFLIDGCHFSMPDTQELRDYFGQPAGQKQGCGFPVAHWLALVHFGTGLIQKAIVSRVNSHDLRSVPQVHPELEADDVVVGDRAFCSFGHLALLLARAVHGIFRAHQKLLIDFTPQRPHAGPKRRRKGQPQRPLSRWIKSLGAEDQLVEWFRPAAVPAWMTAEAWAALPQTLTLRELRYTIDRPGFRVRSVTLVTTLLDPQIYTKEELARAYGLRWHIETCFGHLKTTMRMDVLRCQTVRGVLKELTMFLLVHNLVGMTMLEAAKRQHVAPDRISFVDALRWLATARPGEELPSLVVNPLRPDRIEPRHRKRRPKGPYPWLKEIRSKLKQLLLSQGLGA
jgi:DDE family transposase